MRRLGEFQLLEGDGKRPRDDVRIADWGDRWHVVLELDGGRLVEAWVPKTTPDPPAENR